MKYAFAFLLLIISSFASAQSVTQHMGTVPLNVRFYSNGTALEVNKQFLTRRVPENTQTVCESWFLEFVSLNELRTVKPGAGEEAHLNTYKVVCMDNEKNILFTVYVPLEYMREWVNKDFWTYGLDIRSFPFVLLDNVSIIDITKVAP